MSLAHTSPRSPLPGMRQRPPNPSIEQMRPASQSPVPSQSAPSAPLPARVHMRAGPQ